MPREQVMHPTARVFDAKGEQVDEGRPTHVSETPENGHVSMTPGLAVIWNREPTGYVQIGADISVDSLRNLLEAIDRGEVNTTYGFATIYVDVDRYYINALIRTVRRARNAAFGGDE